jgi:hypothetical protein
MPRSTTTKLGLEQAARSGIQRAGSLRVNPDRLAAMWRMSAQERGAAAHRGEFSLGEMCRWAARCPEEVEIVHGEFFFLAAFTPELAETRDAGR